MYAAAGGASLASRQARKKQAAQNTKNKATNQQILREKLAAKAVTTPTKSKPFHQLPASYLRAPHQHHRKLSAGYTTVPGYDQHHRSLVPISEQSSSSHGVHPPHTPHHIQHHHHHHPGHPEPCFIQHGPPQPAGAHHPPLPKPTGFREYDKLATPPGKLSLQLHSTTTPEDEGRPQTPTPGALERKCSVYRGRKLDPFEEHFYSNNTTTINHQQQPDDVFYGHHPHLPNGEHRRTSYVCKYDSEYYCCDGEHRQLEVCTCDHIECAQGRAAWLERGRRCSVQETPASCHRRWVKRNRIQDSSLGGSSDDEDLLGVLRGPSSFANAFLYVGLGTIAIGLVIAFVGTGEKGFKTVELRLIGPSLIGLGLICCILRILFCICPSHCLSSSRKARNKKNAKIDADHRTSLLRGDSKRVSIARGPHIPTKQPQIYPKSIVKTKTYEGVEALRQIATTSLFLQNEQKVSSNRIVPIIKEPERLEEPPLELKKFETLKEALSVIDIVSISDGEDDDDDARSHKHRPHDPSGKVSDTQVIDLTVEDEQSHSIDSHHQRKDSKLRRQRTSVNQQKPKDAGVTTESSMSSLSPGSSGTAGGGLLMETSLMIIGPTPVSSPTKVQQQSTLTVPMTTNTASSLVTGTSSLKAAPLTQSTSSASAFGAVIATSINTQIPGSLSPLPSTSYLPSAAAIMSHVSPLSPSPTAGLTHYSSTSSSSNLLSPPPMTGFPSMLGSSPATSPGLYDLHTHAINTITTTSSSLQSSAATTTKTEPELVLSPAKLGQ
ncbi:uncharacterized protein LOC131681359 isoform X2 [Topomyia yanbarensis]|uniref:uncharacterized protein LOC131681359 isoform X2 n=1 Tax=Topomyia yanbarensis TaxID=2498891 RepID=UPI00273BAC37|nr:uncharacterized protein LOC131681359 isoform X2 [Topomyia yanbarensis]